jgi:hypothetical protein
MPRWKFKELLGAVKALGTLWTILTATTTLLAGIAPVVLTSDVILRAHLITWGLLGGLVGSAWSYGYCKANERRPGALAAAWRVVAIFVTGSLFYLCLDVLYADVQDLPVVLQELKQLFLAYQRAANFWIAFPFALLVGTLTSGFIAFSNLTLRNTRLRS